MWFFATLVHVQERGLAWLSPPLDSCFTGGPLPTIDQPSDAATLHHVERRVSVREAL